MQDSRRPRQQRLDSHPSLLGSATCKATECQSNCTLPQSSWITGARSAQTNFWSQTWVRAVNKGWPRNPTSASKVPYGCREVWVKTAGDLPSQCNRQEGVKVERDVGQRCGVLCFAALLLSLYMLNNANYRYRFGRSWWVGVRHSLCHYSTQAVVRGTTRASD
jgi:hypothetical protein